MRPDDEIHVVNSDTPAKMAEIEQRGGQPFIS